MTGMNNSEIRIVLGDMNAKIRKAHAFKPTIGEHSLHKTTNDNGIRLTDLATRKGFKIMSTIFPYADIHKGTWRSPDGQYVNHIDHILVNNSFVNNFRDTRVYRLEDCDSDYYLVVGKLNIKLNVRKQIDSFSCV